MEIENEKYRFIPAEGKDFDVDIYMPAYQHEKFVAQAIESVLMQETKYRYRMVICEDCSNDGTRDIVMKYREKYPEKIAVLLWKKNSRQLGLTNGRIGRRFCDSKYYAALECDDFWIDRKKLEKQITLLEYHPEYIACVHNVIKVDENGEILHRDYSQYPIREEHVLTKKDAIAFKHEYQTATLVTRNIFRDWEQEVFERYSAVRANGDRKNFTIICMNGDIFYMREAMSAYRRTYGTDSYNSMIAGHNQSYKIYSDCYNISKYVKEELNTDMPVEEICFTCWVGAMQILTQKPDSENMKVFLRLTKALFKRHGRFLSLKLIKGMGR
ncbi:MAG: glycosyltransferase [Lachnospiraceae bacterium]|nr:glycosyltransferase [Lachnospiraceae bacterium]